MASLSRRISKHLICPISQELMVDPVVAADGNTYERSEITTWLSNHDTSPLDPSCKLNISNLVSNRSVKQQIEELVESEELDDDLSAAFRQRRFEQSPDFAVKLFEEGKIKEAAEHGYAKAQGILAESFYYGTNGSMKDIVKSVDYARKAAASGDQLGQFRLGYAYSEGEGGLPIDWGKAVESLNFAARQGHIHAMLLCADLLKRGGRNLAKDLTNATEWYGKAAEAGDKVGQSKYGLALYKGQGVPKNFIAARQWFQKAADQGDVDAMRRLGTMMLKGEGGVTLVCEGYELWEEAAELGDERAVENIKEHRRAVNSAVFK